jgi:hypothetical protein
MILIRDADKSLQKRHIGTVISEFFSTNLGFNKKIFSLEFVSRELIQDLAIENRFNVEIVDPSKNTSNLIYILKPPAQVKV